MGNILSKKVIIIFSTILVIVLSAVIIAFASGNVQYPGLSKPNDTFYERLDASGNVIYKITNQEVYEQIKSNDGIDQLLYLADQYLLKAYIDQVTQEDIDKTIKELKYGTSDQAEIDKIEANKLLELEAAFVRNMALGGYEGNEEAFAIIVIARKAYARFAMVRDNDITDTAVALDYANNFFEDIKAIRIRFTSSADAANVMKKFNLLILGTTTQSLREYLGFRYLSETLEVKDDDEEKNIVEAYKTITTYYFDDSQNIRDLNTVIVYTKGTNDIYTANSIQYNLDEFGNLVKSSDQEIIIDRSLLFTTKEAALAHKDDNTTYYTVSKVNPFDADERAIVRDMDGVEVYQIDKTGKVWEGEVDVTATSKLLINKIYTPIADITTTTVNNSIALNQEQVLAKYIQIYNYIYANHRDLIPVDATAEDLINPENPHSEFLTFNYLKEVKASSTLAAYMFRTLDLTSTDTTFVPYTVSPRTFTSGGTAFFYLTFKLTQPAKTSYIELMLDEIVKTIKLPAEVAGNIVLPTTGAYGSTITWTSANTAIVSNAGVVTRPAEDTNVKLTYRITLNGIPRTGDVTLKFLKTGQTSEVTNDYVVATFKSLLNDDAFYDTIFQKLVDARMNDASNGAKFQSEKLGKLRAEFGFTIFDRFLGVDYQQRYTAYELSKTGSNSVLASFTGRPGFEGAEKITEEKKITADDLMHYALSKNAAMYTTYAGQWKEILHSTYFESVFGSQKDIIRNRSDKMKQLQQSVAGFKSEFVYYQQLYAQYGLSFPYATVNDYAYVQLGAKTEAEMLQYFIKGALQPYFVNEIIKRMNLVDNFVNEIQENYENYFSLKVSHLIIYLDLNEDGSLDNYFDYKEGLDELKLDEFETLIAGFETAIEEYLDASISNTFTTLITAYNNATRDNETWGTYKRYGFLLKTETLTQKSSYDGETSSDSLFFSGEFGVKSSYVSEYTEALTALYQSYRLDQNKDLTSLKS
ncbi:MAG: hypothetical protein Q8M70_06685, partial [bacterium]|nr:hypothetical protein [bacterium]